MTNAFFICDLVFTVYLIIGLQKCCVIVVLNSAGYLVDLRCTGQKALAQELTSEEQKNVRLLGHLFEQSGNDYLVAGRSPEKGLKEKMTKSFVIRRVFSFYTELFGIPLKSWRELSVQLHLFSLLGVDRLVYP